MASVESEYKRFLTHLADREISEDARRLAYLIFNHLNTLSQVGFNNRGRSKTLVPLALAHLHEMPVFQAMNVGETVSRTDTLRLHQLKVGPFRGFMRPEVFDLRSDITLVYGANGTGKSSFCEALELAMLGSISEAQIKRIEQRQYCNNARIRKHNIPELSASYGHDVLNIQHNESDFRFCFIEKNRLDAFSRIAAKTPGDQRQLIATLFGVEQFSEFVRGFNPSLDSDLMLEGILSKQLEQSRLQLANSTHVISSYHLKISEIEKQENALAKSINPETNFQILVKWLLGSPDEQGRLNYVQTQLDAIPPAIYGVTKGNLEKLLSDAIECQSQWNDVALKLAQRATDVSYAKLFEAVQALAEGANACPACGTELNAVNHDPFARARTGLEELSQLAMLQQTEIFNRNALGESVRLIWDEMCRVVTTASIVCPDLLASSKLPQIPSNSLGIWLSEWIDNGRKNWNSLLKIALFIEELDKKSQEVLAQRVLMTQERDRLNKYQLEIERLKTLRHQADKELNEAQQTINQFDEANGPLIQATNAEVPIVAHHLRIKAAYDSFLPEIHSYLKELPSLLLQGLGDEACKLYNSFNRNDPKSDLLHKLWLPLVENSKIEVEFAGEPGVRYDALLIFSEGHIKCLGLAILLAKNIVQGCPAVIFDDVVNAIDDEHRDGIWRTFFEDGLLDGKQIILTSHAEEFIHRIQQELGASRAGSIKRYKFLPHHGGNELRVDSDPPTKNYVLLAQQALNAEEKRDALRHARPALESLTDRLWTWMGRRGDGRIELKLSGPRSPWELNNKCSKLSKAISRLAEQYEGAQEASTALIQLLSVSGASIEWGYLNSGVHDSQRDHEFDRVAVRTIVESIVSLDAALSTLQKR